MKSLFVFSDLHYPNRTKDKDLLGKLEKLITENDITIGCGDYVSENIIELVQHTAKNYFLVKGNMDFFDLNLPQMISIKIEDLNIGIIHGDGAPFGIEKRIIKRFELLPDVVFYGHTHTKENKNINNIHFINPGALLDGNYCICLINGKNIEVKFYKIF